MVHRQGHKPDYLIIFCVWFLVIFGLVMLASASSNLGRKNFGDTYYYLKHQIYYGLSLGIIGFFLASKIPYGKYRNKFINLALLVLSLILVALVFSPLGFRVGGAARWLKFGSFTFQPSDILKLSFIIYLASWLSRHENRQTKFWEGFLPFLIVLGIISGLLFAQHSTSPVVILGAVALIMYFVSGARLRYIFSIVIIGALALGAIIAITPYRTVRVLTFLNPEADPLKSGFQVLQAKTAIGSGGLFGRGYGQSTVKFRLPEPIGDSIFAVIGEEFGFLGALFVVGLFALLVIRIFILARRIPDRFGQLLLFGFGSLIGLQAIINIGALVGVLPLTGTPLPFISYGGTALAVFMTMAGIVVNVSRHIGRG